MQITMTEQWLCRFLCDLPLVHSLRYDDDARRSLLQTLFRCLVGEKDDTLNKLFHGKVPSEEEDWILRNAQGAVDGAEYTETARGKACGHILKNGEATYRCKTCTLDDTCVLCSRCYDASDHTGHMVYVSISSGNAGCCDCGDPEAWKIPVNCAIHTLDSSTSSGKRKLSVLPSDLVESMQMTIGRVLDYFCDVISCSPEQLRLPKTEESIRHNEKASRLSSSWYEESEETDLEFALILWNDEKHTVEEVQHQVARACKLPRRFGLEKANETNDIGRSIVRYSHDVGELLRIAKIIEDIKITITIRSSRDIFREQMCGTLIEWLADISGCSIGGQNDALRETICDQMLKLWRAGSGAINATVGKDGIDDHGGEDASQFTNGLAYAHLFNTRRARIPNPEDTSDADTVENDDGQEQVDVPGEDEDMDLGNDLFTPTPTARHTEDMQARPEPEDETEALEATYAGYPPPPPPPAQVVSVNSRLGTFPTIETGHPPMSPMEISRTNIDIPKTPATKGRSAYYDTSKPPRYWLEQPRAYASKDPIPLFEDLRQRVRLDWMILFDLRLWKKARIDLRELYITTVVTLPSFKRILALRFAGLYTVLAQLYLIADREPDHSIINLSVQMLTSPSITQEVVERGNFFTNLLAIAYTFLTQRQVGHPHEISVSSTLAVDAGSITNRRMYHIFTDLKHLLSSEYVREILHTEERYLFQFLDFIKLPQGISPNVRAVGDHIEYETDAWISASLLTREVNKLCRQFAELFRWKLGEGPSSITRAIKAIARATIINSLGVDRARFDQAEIKHQVRFKRLEPFEFDPCLEESDLKYTVVDYVVEKEPISFHHALHYTLSWLIDGAKSMSKEQIRRERMLEFLPEELIYMQPRLETGLVPGHDPETYLMALFDYPLRVCAWLAQMKAGMWVRNGLSLRHQMATYRGVSHRELAHHRDIFLLQVASVICNPTRVLASIVERFGMNDWMRGNYCIRPGFEESQQLDVAEDFIHLLIVLLCERTSLHPIEEEPNPQSLAIRREILHILSFKPMSFSDLTSRLGDRFQDLEEFQDILNDLTHYKPPEGMSDTGTFVLKMECLESIDPYVAHFTKNQRDEAELAYRTWIAKKTRKPIAEVVLEPKPAFIGSGLFKDLAEFTKTPLFAQIIFYSLGYALHNDGVSKHDILSSRVEAFLQVVLHLILAAIAEDDTNDDAMTDENPSSFVYYAFTRDAVAAKDPHASTIYNALRRLSQMDGFRSSHAKIRLAIQRLQQKGPRIHAAVLDTQDVLMGEPGAVPPRMPSIEDIEAKKREDQAIRNEKKRQALDRQARVMAQFQQQQQNFLKTQGHGADIDWGSDDDTDSSGATEDQKKMWKYPVGNCIVCQEGANDTRLMGACGIIMNNDLFRQTKLVDPDFVSEVVSTPTSLDRAADSIRPFGVSGQNRKQIRKLASDGREVVSEHQGLGKGFPIDHTITGPISTGCGHLMHYDCFQNYCSATVRRHQHQISRNHPERSELKEFVCPLCKALGNTFLPIVWRSKEVTYPGVLQATMPYDIWLSSLGITMSKFYKQAVGVNPFAARYKQMVLEYMAESIEAPPQLSSRLRQIIDPESLATPSLSPPGDSSRGNTPPSLTSTSVPHLSRAPSADKVVLELSSSYYRIRDTITANRISSRFVHPRSIEDLSHLDTLARSLGYSIASTEIAQRGIAAGMDPELTFLGISPLTLSHLRVFSETVSSYIAVGSLRSDENHAVLEFSTSIGRQLVQLFAGHPDVVGSENWTSTVIPSLLAQDSFIFLAECSVGLVPALNMDIYHVIRLCYLKELVTVVLALLHSRDIGWNGRPFAGFIIDQKETPALATFYDFTNFVSAPFGRQMSHTISKEDLPKVYTLLHKYALPFLRKVALLLHIRYGVDFPVGSLATEESELNRLTKVLRLPSMTEMMNSVLLNRPEGSGIQYTRSIVLGWIQHCNLDAESSSSNGSKRSVLPSLGHPAIYELIGLPETFSTLTDEAMRRRCPTTGKDLVDPAICLFCGDIFCSQAVCCQRHNTGGCNQHMVEYVWDVPFADTKCRS